MSITPGSTSEEIRGFVREYQMVKHGQKRVWLLAKHFGRDYKDISVGRISGGTSTEGSFREKVVLLQFLQGSTPPFKKYERLNVTHMFKKSRSSMHAFARQKT
jgi:hypothetical protein